jgi:hypothetical protein
VGGRILRIFPCFRLQNNSPHSLYDAIFQGKEDRMNTWAAAVAALVVIVPAGAGATDRYVTDGQFIQPVINIADPGDVIHVAGTRAEQVVVWKDVTLAGETGASITPPRRCARSASWSASRMTASRATTRRGRGS